MSAVLPTVEQALVEHFGHPPSRASVSFVGVEPIEVLRFASVAGDVRAYASLGMSRYPMTGAAESVVDEKGPRAELIVSLRDPANLFGDVWRSLAVLAAAPVVQAAVHAPGTTSDLGEPLAPGSTCTGVVIDDAIREPVSTPAGAVQLLRAVPATRGELAWCRVRGAAALLERWRAAGTDLLDLARPPVELGGAAP